MELIPRQRHRGIRQIGQGLGTLDREVFDAIAESPSPLLDSFMPRLTAAADHSKLWVVIAAALMATGRSSVQRGAGRGLASLAVTSLVTNQLAKRVWKRPRPNFTPVPVIRRSSRMPTSNSLPSGHTASGAAFAVGVGLESAPVGLVLALLAGMVGVSRVATGAHYPVADPLRVETPRRPDGEGVVLVINPASGSGTGARVLAEARRALPRMEIVELSKDDDLQEVLRSAAERAEVLAVGGGDGTVAGAAGVALAADRPLAVFAAGTFNHFARDIGCETVAKTVECIREGRISCVDVLRLNETGTVINTASIGAYPAFVATREKLEHKIGKPAAGVYAMFHTLRRSEPVRIHYDNKTVETSLFFLGNSSYLPSGFAPARRLRLDDGLMDVRILETERRFATVRILTSLAFGRLVRSPLYHELRVPEFSFRAVDGPTPLAHDGELAEKMDEASFSVRYRALQVFRPLP
jgi:diacylglycerol kinase family enzyme